MIFESMTTLTLDGKEFEIGYVVSCPTDGYFICSNCSEQFIDHLVEYNHNLKHHCFTKIEYTRFENKLNKLIDKFQFKGGWSADWQLKMLPFKIRINRLRIQADSKKKLLNKIETKIRHNKKRNKVKVEDLIKKGDFMGYMNHVMNEISTPK